MIDNTTPVLAGEYDRRISQSLPYLSTFYEQTLDLVETLGCNGGRWLDTGCGTGAFVERACEQFPTVEFVVCDPSPAMMDQAKARLAERAQVAEFRVCPSQAITDLNAFGVITAIQAHHYMEREDRVRALEACHDALKVDGALVVFENFAPASERGKAVVMDRWGRYQKAQGKTDAEVLVHQGRYGVSYFPIGVDEHVRLLREVGFSTVEVFWLSYMQVGVYGIK